MQQQPKPPSTPVPWNRNKKSSTAHPQAPWPRTSSHAGWPWAPVPAHLPLFDHGAHLVPGEVHAVEVGEAVFALHVLGDELELAKGHFIVLQVGEAHLEDAALEAVGGDFCRGDPSLAPGPEANFTPKHTRSPFCQIHRY